MDAAASCADTHSRYTIMNSKYTCHPSPQTLIPPETPETVLCSKKRRLEAEPRDLTKLAHISYAKSQGNCEQQRTRFALNLQTPRDQRFIRSILVKYALLREIDRLPKVRFLKSKATTRWNGLPCDDHHWKVSDGLGTSTTFLVPWLLNLSLVVQEVGVEKKCESVKMFRTPEYRIRRKLQGHQHQNYNAQPTGLNTCQLYHSIPTELFSKGHDHGQKFLAQNWSKKAFTITDPARD